MICHCNLSFCYTYIVFENTIRGIPLAEKFLCIFKSLSPVFVTTWLEVEYHLKYISHSLGFKSQRYADDCLVFKFCSPNEKDVL